MFWNKSHFTIFFSLFLVHISAVKFAKWYGTKEGKHQLSDSERNQRMELGMEMRKIGKKEIHPNREENVKRILSERVSLFHINIILNKSLTEFIKP